MKDKKLLKEIKNLASPKIVSNEDRAKQIEKAVKGKRK